MEERLRKLLEQLQTIINAMNFVFGELEALIEIDKSHLIDKN